MNQINPDPLRTPAHPSGDTVVPITMPADLAEGTTAQAKETVETATKDKPAEAPVELNAFARQIAEFYQANARSPNIMIGQIRLLELLILILCGMVSSWTMMPVGLSFAPVHILMAATTSLVAVVVFQFTDAYQVPRLRSPVKALPRILAGWSIVILLTVLSLWMLHEPGVILRRMVVGWWAIAGAVLILERTLVSYGIRHWSRDGTMERRAVIVGGGDAARKLIRDLENQQENDIRICGIFDDRNSARSPEIVAGYPKLGTVDELVEFARLARIDMLIISLPLSAEDRIMHLLRKLWVLPLDIRLAAHSNNLRFRPRTYSHIGSVAMLDIFDKPIRDWDSVAKRVFDITFSLIALALLWPVMIGTAIAIKLNSKGPVFFIQKRHGFNNEVINVFKFRSMYSDQSDFNARQVVTKGDPRVTSVGRIIRKTSIDELPQLFNVLRGELSLVGPRPHAVTAHTRNRLWSEVADGYFARHRVKPGVTGWAQINGWRGEVDTDEKIRARTAFDLYYIENWSLFFDLKILFLTPIRLLNTENAY